MNKTMLGLATALACLMPLGAIAAEHCTHSAPRALQLDLAGVTSVRFETAQHTLRLDARPGGAHAVTGRACAAKASWLEQLTLTQEKRGDTLVVRAARDAGNIGLSLGDSHAYLDLSGSVPAGIAVQLAMGSGDVHVTGIASLDATVGSGDLEVRNVRGPVVAKVGSGDVMVDGAASLAAGSIGSGDFIARNIGGQVEVGSIGSGDFELAGARGNVRIESIGSGDATLADIDGDVGIGSIGSGDLDVRDVRGRLSVRSLGSGDVAHRTVSGGVDLPRKR